ncbi:phage head completion protein [Shinella zoogloeoides]|uniref:phage head completion protein n=1 Tax=Shinella zoogloeoides TaxID=352475 RepID=UPI001F5ACB02|nr:head-tail adaptor protein [Shinella zoogloeoides]
MADRGSGQLYERVAFDERALQSDGHGNEQEDFVEAFECRAGFTYLRGTEAVIAARLEGRQPIVVRVRRNSKTEQIDHDWRMRNLRDGEWAGGSGEEYWKGPTYAVRSVIPTTDRQWIDITVESGTAA